MGGLTVALRLGSSVGEGRLGGAEGRLRGRLRGRLMGRLVVG